MLPAGSLEAEFLLLWISSLSKTGHITENRLDRLCNFHVKCFSQKCFVYLCSIIISKIEQIFLLKMGGINGRNMLSRLELQGGSNMTGTVTGLFTHK